MTEQSRDSLADEQQELALKLDAINKVQNFYKKNESSLWFRLFFPTRLGRALLEDNYDYKEVFAAYFARSRWMRFFFGGFPEIDKFTTSEASVKAFSVLGEDRDLALNYSDHEVNEFAIYVANEEIKSFLNTGSKSEGFKTYFQQNKMMVKDLFEIVTQDIEEATIKNLDNLSTKSKLKVREIMLTIGKQTKARSKIGSQDAYNLPNWSFPLLKVIIDNNDEDLLEVLYDLVMDKNSTFSSGNIKSYTINLLCLPKPIVKDAALIIRAKQMDLGTRYKLLNEGIIATEKRDIGFQRYLAEKAESERIASQQAQQKSTNNPDTFSETSSNGSETVVAGYTGGDEASVSSANTVTYDAEANNALVFLSNLFWWGDESTNRDNIKKMVALKTPAEKQILEAICNGYGRVNGSEITKERFMKILSLSNPDLLALEALITALQGGHAKAEGSPAETVSIAKIIDGTLAVAQSGSRYSLFSVDKSSGAIAYDQQSLDDSSTSSVTTSSSVISDSQAATSKLQELAFVVSECDKNVPDILQKLLESNNFNPAVKVIIKLLKFQSANSQELFESINKLLTLSEDQIMDVYMLLMILEKDNNQGVCTFKNLNMAIHAASEHTIVSDLQKYDKLFSGEVELDNLTFPAIIGNQRAQETVKDLHSTLQAKGYQTSRVDAIVSQTAGLFSKGAKIFGNISSMVHNERDSNIDRKP